jgi:transcriptional regulator with XRE-family HTH domain
MTDIRKVFANRLKEARVEMGLDQPEFGERLGGLSVQMLSQYENGHAMASHKTFSKILEATGKPLAWFFLRPGEALVDPADASALAQALAAISRAREELDLAESVLGVAEVAAPRKRGSTKIDPHFGRKQDPPGNDKHGNP